MLGPCPCILHRQVTKTPMARHNRPKYRPKHPRIKNEPHLNFIRSLPCLVTGTAGVDAAHIRYSDHRCAKRAVGIGEKPDDKFTIPLCRQEHQKQHSMNEREYWTDLGIDPVFVALALWSVSGDEESGERIVQEARLNMGNLTCKREG